MWYLAPIRAYREQPRRTHTKKPYRHGTQSSRPHQPPQGHRLGALDVCKMYRIGGGLHMYIKVILGEICSKILNKSEKSWWLRTVEESEKLRKCRKVSKKVEGYRKCRKVEKKVEKYRKKSKMSKNIENVEKYQKKSKNIENVEKYRKCRKVSKKLEKYWNCWKVLKKVEMSKMPRSIEKKVEFFSEWWIHRDSRRIWKITKMSKSIEESR